MIVLAHLGSQVFKISHSWVAVQIFYILLFGVMMWLHDRYNKGTATMQPSYPKFLLATRAGFAVMTLRQSSNNPLDGKVQTNRDWNKWDRWTAKSRACSTFSLASRGLFIKNSSWQAIQSIPHTILRIYDDCVKMCKDFALNIGDKNWLLHHDNAPSHINSWYYINSWLSINFWHI
jgi:hypothetical protein